MDGHSCKDQVNSARSRSTFKGHDLPVALCSFYSREGKIRQHMTKMYEARGIQGWQRCPDFDRRPSVCSKSRIRTRNWQIKGDVGPGP